MAKKTTPAQLRDTLIKGLREYGFTVDEKENTRGARKVWMTKKVDSDEYFLPTTLVEIFDKIVPERHPRILKDTISTTILGTGFTAELQHYRPETVTVFIAVYNTGLAGLEYEMGVDC